MKRKWVQLVEKTRVCGGLEEFNDKNYIIISPEEIKKEEQRAKKRN